jgi:soluble lytic murein transglycosylase-like protein
MKKKVSMAVGGMALLAFWSTSSLAQEKWTKIVRPDGSTVITNVVDSTPLSPPPVPTVSNTASDPISALITVISGNHGVDPALVRAMIKAESNFNRWAVSSKGALGLMQLIPTTGARYGVRDFFDPQQNIEGGVRYIRFLLEKFNGNLDLSLAAYNAGENLVERLGRIPPIRETQDYVRRVRAAYGKSSAPAVAAMSVSKPESQQIFRTVDERGVIHFSNIAPPK